MSGAYDGKIKVWDLQAALDTRKPPNSLCIRTLMVWFVLSYFKISFSTLIKVNFSVLRLKNSSFGRHTGEQVPSLIAQLSQNNCSILS